MRPSNLNLSIGKTVGYNNKILISNTDMKIGFNKDINKDHKKSSVTRLGSEREEGAAHGAPKMHLIRSTDKPNKRDTKPENAC